MDIKLICFDLDDTLITCEFIIFGVAYYIIAFGDSYLNIYPTTDKTIELIRFILTSS